MVVAQALFGNLQNSEGKVFFAQRELTPAHPKRKWRAKWSTFDEVAAYILSHIPPSTVWTARGSVSISVWDAEMNTFLNKGAGRETAAVRHRLQTARVNAGLPRNPVAVEIGGGL